jgi:hypothetical protein
MIFIKGWMKNWMKAIGKTKTILIGPWDNSKTLLRNMSRIKPNYKKKLPVAHQKSHDQTQKADFPMLKAARKALKARTQS